MRNCMEIIEITTDVIKIDQLIKFAGIVSSGSDVKMMIAKGMVKVNGEICNQRNKKISPGDIIDIEDYGTLKVKSV